MPSRVTSPLPDSCRVLDGGVEIRHDLRVRNFRNDGADLIDGRELRDIALPRVELGGDREIAQLGEAPADILDVFVDAEDLLHDQHYRKRPAARWHRAISRDRLIADRNLHFACSQAFGAGGNRQPRSRAAQPSQTPPRDWSRPSLAASLPPATTHWRYRPADRDSWRIPRRAVERCECRQRSGWRLAKSQTTPAPSALCVPCVSARGPEPRSFSRRARRERGRESEASSLGTLGSLRGAPGWGPEAAAALTNR